MTYYIVDSTADLIEPLAIYFDKEDAYNNLKYFCSIYPDGWVEVLTEDELISMKG
jgi:dihydroorotase